MNNKCLNNDKCVSNSNGYKCICKSGFDGVYCQNCKIFLLIEYLNKFKFILNIQDDSCWNNPCEGCQQTKANDTEYLCTCSKYTSVNCKSEIKRKILNYAKINLN